jgi:creatinine amidohydrolase/Fe(II)-dependent formamide hydrolase-like protein
LTVKEAARVMFGVTGDPSKAETEKARRALDRLVDKGLPEKVPGTRGGIRGQGNNRT